MYKPILGSVSHFAFNFAPAGWLQCQGQLLDIRQNAALYSLLGIAYGGNGMDTFGLPDLQGRTIAGYGVASNTDYKMGLTAGSGSVTMDQAHLPTHTHTAHAQIPVNTSGSTTTIPTAAYLSLPSATQIYNSAPSDGATYGKPGAIIAGIDTAGGSVPFDIQNPYLALTICIAAEGFYPERP